MTLLLSQDGIKYVHSYVRWLCLFTVTRLLCKYTWKNIHTHVNAMFSDNIERRRWVRERESSMFLFVPSLCSRSSEKGSRMVFFNIYTCIHFLYICTNTLILILEFGWVCEWVSERVGVWASIWALSIYKAVEYGLQKQITSTAATDNDLLYDYIIRTWESFW